MSDWVKVGTGYSDRSQQVPFKQIIAWQEQVFVMSNLLYYGHHQPVLSDRDYDATVDFLERHFDDTSKSFRYRFTKGQLKVEAHGTKARDGEMENALAWVERVNRHKSRSKRYAFVVENSIRRGDDPAQRLDRLTFWRLV